VFWFIEYALTQTTEEEAKSSLAQLFRDLNRMGVTSVSDAGANDSHPKPGRVMNLFNDDEATVRISFMELTSRGMDATLHALTEETPIEPGENVHPHLDHGFQFEAVGEVLVMDFQNLRTISDWENFMQPIYSEDPDYIREVTLRDARKLLDAGIPFRIHATYNETISPILDALEQLNAETPFNGLRWSLEHAETISEENIARVAALGGAIAVQDRMAMHGDDFVNTNGIEMARQSPPMRAMLDAGIPFSLGTDGLRASSFNPWVTIEWAVTGDSVSGQSVLSEENRLTREEALFAYTVGSAWHQYQEDTKGRIMPGQLADITLLNMDYFEVDGDELDNIHALLTVMDGEVVYGEGVYSELDNDLPEAMPAWSPINFYRAYE
jgi:predicted amidohydrolase YtcJ